MLERVSTAIAVGVSLISSLTVAATSPYDGVTTIENPGGGTIAYAQMRPQTVQSAMEKVLGYVNSRFGAPPQVARVVKSSDGTMLAAAFNVSPSGGNPEIAGLAIVIVPRTGTAEGAVLSDNADRFRTTFKSMYERLQSQAGVAQGAGGSPTPAPSTADSAPSAATPASTPTAAAPAAALHQVAFADGTGSIGLPAGWNIVSSYGGDVIAKGPRGEQLQFGQPISVLDPRNPRTGVLGTGAGRCGAGCVRLHSLRNRRCEDIRVGGSADVSKAASIAAKL